MTDVQSILEQIRRTPGCTAAASRGMPVLRDEDRLPDDLAEFYRRCGGARLFDGSDYAIRIVGPDELVRSNPEIVGAECSDDISDSWYIVARGGREEAISIDCNAERLGRCYDSFWDRHGVAGDCAIVALSFTELLRRLLGNQGGHWYWLVAEWTGLGDAYRR